MPAVYSQKAPKILGLTAIGLVGVLGIVACGQKAHVTHPAAPAFSSSRSVGTSPIEKNSENGGPTAVAQPIGNEKPPQGTSQTRDGSNPIQCVGATLQATFRIETATGSVHTGAVGLTNRSAK